MASQDVTVSQHKHSILVTGDTFSIKDSLKSLGGRWNKPLKGWIFRQRDRDKVVAGLRALPVIAITDQTSQGSGAATTTAAAAGVQAAAEVDDYSDLAANPTPNKGTFGERGVPGERQAAQLPEALRHHPMFGLGGRTIEYTPHGDFSEVRSRRELEKKRAEEQWGDCDGGGVPWMPKISIEGSRHKQYTRTERFTCDGTMYRHSMVSWEDAPVEFQRPHEVEASRGKGAVRSTCFEHKIEDCTPFDCDVYWETVWEKCPSCQEADQAFKRWAMRASAPAAVAAMRKKRKANEAASATASTSADEVESQGEAKIQKAGSSSSLTSATEVFSSLTSLSSVEPSSSSSSSSSSTSSSSTSTSSTKIASSAAAATSSPESSSLAAVESSHEVPA